MLVIKLLACIVPTSSQQHTKLHLNKNYL